MQKKKETWKFRVTLTSNQSGRAITILVRSLIYLLKTKNLILLKNTHLPTKTYHLATLRSPHGNKKSQEIFEHLAYKRELLFTYNPPQSEISNIFILSRNVLKFLRRILLGKVAIHLMWRA